MDIVYNSPLTETFNGMNINLYDLAYVKMGKEWNSERTCSGYTRIYMIIAGGGNIEYGGKTVCMKPGNIYVIPAGLEFSYNCDDYLEKLYFHVSIPGQNNYDIFNVFSECIELCRKDEYIKECVKLFKSHDLIGVIKMKRILYEILSECGSAEFGDINTYSEITDKAIKYIEKNLSAALTIEKVAKSLFISQSKLQKEFRKDIGVSPGKYIDDRLMLKAECELKKRNVSVKEISDKLGFCDQFYFSRKFSAKYGMSPIKYKKNCGI